MSNQLTNKVLMQYYRGLMSVKDAVENIIQMFNDKKITCLDFHKAMGILA